ncbi:MAG: prenyltransferase/squalene oxidase repeat-containing protein [Planctomycetota bacterium]
MADRSFDCEPERRLLTRRKAMAGIGAVGSLVLGGIVPAYSSTLLHSSSISRGTLSSGTASSSGTSDNELDQAVQKGLEWLAGSQTRTGSWPHDTYPTAMAALAGTALLCGGSTTTQGPFAQNIRRTVDFLTSKCRRNGLIGDPQRDNRYTYGHGFAMLFLSQVLGEEEDMDRRQELTGILERAVEFSVSAQTEEGGWGYVSGEDNSFDEGSTTITQVQGLRGCRNAGIVVPRQAIDDARNYIYKCQNSDGGISYSTGQLGSSRPAITAAALAALYNAGDYESEYIPTMWEYCKKNLHNIQSGQYGHWHYTYLYYTQVVYRQNRDVWEPFRDRLYSEIIADQRADGSWDGQVGAVYVTSCNLIMLQMDNGFLPIYQR